MEAFLHPIAFVFHHQAPTMEEQMIQGLTECKLLPSILASMGR